MPKDVDADAVEIGALYRAAMGDVTDSRYFSEKISQNRNGTPEARCMALCGSPDCRESGCRNRSTPDACHWCRKPFVAGQMRYPILDATVRGWAIASVCMRCFKHPDCNAENTTKLNRKRLECVGCGEPIFTPTNTKKGAWDCCSNRCYQRAYRKRRRQYGSTIAWKWAEGGRHECECCKKSIGGKRKDSRFCSNKCRQWQYRQRRLSRESTQSPPGNKRFLYKAT